MPPTTKPATVRTAPAAWLLGVGALLLLRLCSCTDAARPHTGHTAGTGAEGHVNIISDDSTPAAGRQLLQQFSVEQTIQGYITKRIKVPDRLLLSPDRAGSCGFTIFNLCSQGGTLKVAVDYWTTNGANQGMLGFEKKGWFTVPWNTSITFAKLKTVGDPGIEGEPAYLIGGDNKSRGIDGRGCVTKASRGTFHLFFAWKGAGMTPWWSYNAATKSWTKTTDCDDKINAYYSESWRGLAACGERTIMTGNCSPP